MTEFLIRAIFIVLVTMVVGYLCAVEIRNKADSRHERPKILKYIMIFFSTPFSLFLLYILTVVFFQTPLSSIIAIVVVSLCAIYFLLDTLKFRILLSDKGILVSRILSDVFIPWSEIKSCVQTGEALEAKLVFSLTNGKTLILKGPITNLPGLYSEVENKIKK